MVLRVTERIVAAVEDQTSPGHIVSAWPPPDTTEIKTASLGEKESIAEEFRPSAIARSKLMPFQPETSNPTKVLPTQDWRIYVIDMVWMSLLRYWEMLTLSSLK